MLEKLFSSFKLDCKIFLRLHLPQPPQLLFEQAALVNNCLYLFPCFFAGFSNIVPVINQSRFFFYIWDYALPTSYLFVFPTLPKLRLNLKSNTQTFYLIVLLQPTITIYYNNKTNFLMFSSFLALKKLKSHSLVLELYKEYYMIYVTCG